MYKKVKYLIYFQLLATAFGQFGQNIVQYDDFTWNFIQSKHFDIYYAEDGRSHAGSFLPSLSLTRIAVT